MNLAWYDWSIVAFVFLLMLAGVLASRGLMRSVADFLAAGRSAGRYVLSVSSGIAALGAITIVNLLEMNYQAGFTQTWWGFTMGLVMLALTVTGWVNYRYRQTRALTLAQFFEMRYSRSFRVFAGLISFISGLVNFGIFPSVGARFFIHYCGLPEHFLFLGFQVGMFPLLMALLLSISLFFVYTGGQIAVVVSDFLQGLFVNLVFVLLLLFVLTQFEWSHIGEAMAMAPVDASKINPFHTSHLEDFNLWYFLIGVFGVIYGAMSWQGTSGYNASAINAHEAKMGGVLSTWRTMGQSAALLLIPIMAYTVMHHPSYAGIQESVNGVLAAADTDTIRNQLRVPLVLVQVLPPGLLGAFAALMLGAFVSTHDTYLHSWGTILVQDVILPFRRKPLAAKQHLLALRLSILFVAVFIFGFSMWFPANYEYIAMFFAITGAIFAGGSGAVIIGGLYWKRGTAAAAWTAMLAGSGTAVAGIVIQQWPEAAFAGAAPAGLGWVWLPLRAFRALNGQQVWMLAMAGSSLLYVAVSLLGPRKSVDMDRLLHRGRWDTAGEIQVVVERPGLWWRIFGMGKEFNARDRALYVATYAWTFFWGLLFGVGTVWNLTHDVSDASWMGFWRVYIWFYLAVSFVVLIWFGIGGFADLKRMFTSLSVAGRDQGDDGRVEHSEEPA